MDNLKNKQFITGYNKCSERKITKQFTPIYKMFSPELYNFLNIL